MLAVGPASPGHYAQELIPMMGFHDGNWSGGDWLAMNSMMLLFWAVAIGLVIWVARSFRNERQRPGSDHPNTAGPDDILSERYARGEIDDDEFQRRRELLHSNSNSSAHTRSTP
jgi:putative membrane protein